jgi:hypothetical protein
MRFRVFDRLICVLSLALLFGCENLDRVNTTDFTPPGSDGRFRYKGTADAIYTVDSADAEQRRLRMLDEWLRLNGQCRSGYEIISRNPVRGHKDYSALSMTLGTRVAASLNHSSAFLPRLDECPAAGHCRCDVEQSAIFS